MCSLILSVATIGYVFICRLVSFNWMCYNIFQNAALLFERCGLCGCTSCYWDSIIRSDSYLLTIEKKHLACCTFSMHKSVKSSLPWHALLIHLHSIKTWKIKKYIQIPLEVDALYQHERVTSCCMTGSVQAQTGRVNFRTPLRSSSLCDNSCSRNEEQPASQQVVLFKEPSHCTQDGKKLPC